MTVDTAAATAGMERLSAKTEATASRMEAAGARVKNFGGTLTGLGRAVTTMAIPVALLGGYAIKSALDFESAMTRLKTQAQASSKEVKFLTEGVLKMGGKSVAGPNELAEALYFIRSNGIKGKEALEAVNAAQKGMAISGAGVVETSKALAGVMHGAFPDIHSAAGAMGAMNAAVGLGKMKLQEFNSALETGTMPVVTQAGLGFRDYAVAIDVASRLHVPAVQESTNLRKSLLQMMTVTGISQKALGKMGISAFQLAHELHKPHGLIDALKTLKEHMTHGGMDEFHANRLISEAFGRSKGAGNILILLKGLKEQEELYKQSPSEQTGAKKLNQAYNTASQTDAVKMQKAISGLKTALVELGQVLLPVVIPIFLKLVEWLKAAVEWFKRLPGPAKEVGVAMGIAAVVGGPLLLFMGALVNAVGNLMKIIPTLIKILPGFGAAAGEAGTAASAGMATLLIEIGALVAAAATLLALWKAIQAIKDFLDPSGGGGKPKTRAGRALQKFHQHSEAFSNTHGALAQLTGGGHVAHPGALAPGSAAEADELRRHAGALGQTELTGGKREASLARERQIEKDLKERNEFIVHTHVHLDSKQIAEVTSAFLRDNPSSKAAKHLGEAVLRNSRTVNARTAH